MKFQVLDFEFFWTRFFRRIFLSWKLHFSIEFWTCLNGKTEAANHPEEKAVIETFTTKFKALKLFKTLTI